MDPALGLYRPGRGPLYGIHPIPKLLLMLWAVVAPFVLPAEALPGLAVLVVGGCVALGLRGSYVRRFIVTTIPALASIILINAFFFPGGQEVVFAVGPLAATREGLAFGLPIAGRVVVAVGATLAFVTATRPDDLMEALVQRGAPASLAFVVLATIQTVPRMQEKARRILDAQQARGLRTRGGVRARARALVPLVGPLVIGSLVDVRDRTLALEARGFGSTSDRTAYRVIEMKRSDRSLMLVCAMARLALPAYVGARLVGLF